MTAIGLFGGSFDPIHNGHIAIAHAALEQLNLDELHFITAQQNPHKDSVLSPEQRHNLVSQAIATEKKFKAIDIELNRPAPSYTSDTINEYQNKYPEAKLYLLMGIDSYNSLPTWRNPEKFAELDLIVYPRNQQSAPQIHKFLQQDKVHFLKMPEIPVSSSSIRELLRNPPDNLEDKLKKLIPATIKTQVHEYYSGGFWA